ncbi:propionyl-CoA synthetase [Colwellia psychrerythraea]|uniref:Acid-CoA ligase family protein n=1 Tax=Colwellia psychrerythraea (strain 34H / ATCC BAA-681) TaxID=167879 RepID=Q487U9_COLP3|nr:propionyl-CoA synthetase [Colwellia psychrerythraea]AAZ27391.1 acid-CoA ligase family protein [Colwellia psychrerythraea 34H]
MKHIEQQELAINSPESYWKEQSELVAWYKKPQTILSTNTDSWHDWFADGELNSCYLALDYHVEQGRGAQTALIYDSPVTGKKQKFSYLELTSLVAKFADVLRSQDVTKGDRVLIYMPMIPQAAIAMLACARLGAIHSVVFGGFAANELAVRINDAEPKVIVGASCGVEIAKVIPYKPLIDQAIEIANHKPKNCIIYQREEVQAQLVPNRDLDWQEQMDVAVEIPAVPVKSTDPLYILYTSGTTGKPKGVVRDNGGHAVAMLYSMKNIYGMQKGDTFWAASDVGWVVGHSYIIYGTLMAGCTTIVYEGKPIRTPDAGAFWRVCAEYKVNALFSAPTAFRAIGKEDPEGDLLKDYDLSSLKRLFLAGERLDPATYHWLKEKTQLPVIDHWWQTETGWAIASTPLDDGSDNIVATKAGSAGFPIAGFDVQILDGDGQQVPAGQQGSVAIKLPLPPGCLATIYRDSERLVSGYLSNHPGYYTSGDGGYIDEEGYLFIMGRIDDVINVAGHRLSTGEMEEVLSGHPAVAECAVVGIHDALKGQVPLGLVVIKNGITTSDEDLISELKQSIRNDIGAIASLKKLLIIDRLPKTRSGKILRKTLRQMIDGQEIEIPSTIEDSQVITELSGALVGINKD